MIGGGGGMSTLEDFSISNSVSKGSLLEDDEFTAAAMEDALLDKERSISDERIRNKDWIRDTYQVISEAISGGMGDVWKVHHKSWNVDLAMKRPRASFFSEAGPKRKKAFIKECENWIQLGLHPNIVTCYYVREISGVPSVFSEWMDQGSLRDCINNGTLYNGEEEEVTERILDIAIQSAWGLSYSHEHDLIHQDIKPGNLLLNSSWETKIADFGLAQAGRAVRQSSGYSPAYCPKEQADGAEPERWMDIYSWAVTVLEMYSEGRKWETGAQVKDEFEQILTDIRRRIPEGLPSLLEKCIRSGGSLTFTDIIRELEKIYTNTTQHGIQRTPPRAASDSADSLNNYALSFYDLGRREKAFSLWAEAFRKDSRSVPAAYNTALYGYRQGLLDDLAAVEQVKTVVSPGENNSEAYLALARIQAECRDIGILETLDRMEELFPDMEDNKELLSLRREQAQNSPEEIYHYKNPWSGMVEISPDGQYLLVHSGGPGKDEKVHFVEAADRKEISSMVRPPGSFEPAEAHIRVSKDHKFCFGSYMRDPYVYRWRTADGELTLAMVMRKLPGESIAAYGIDAAGTNMLFASNQGRMVFRNAESGEMKALNPVSGNFTVGMSSSGKWGLTALYEQDKVVIQGFGEEKYLEIQVTRPSYAGFVLQDEAVLTVSENIPPRLCLHDSATGELRYEVPFPRFSEFTARQRQVSFSCDGRRVLFSMEKGFLLFSVPDHRWLFTLTEKHTNLHRNLIVRGRLAGDGNDVYLSTFTDELKGYRLPEIQEASPWMLSRIRSVRKNLEEEDQFAAACSNAGTAMEKDDLETALDCLREAGEIGGGKFKTGSAYMDLVRKIALRCSISGLRRPYIIDSYSIFHDEISSLSISPDGKWICALSTAGELAVLEAGSCKVVYRDRFRRHAHKKKVQWAGSAFYSIVIGKSRNPFSKEGDRRVKTGAQDGSGYDGSMGISFKGLDLLGRPGGQVYAFDMGQYSRSLQHGHAEMSFSDEDNYSIFDRQEPFLQEDDVTDFISVQAGKAFLYRKNGGAIYRCSEGNDSRMLFLTEGDFQITGSCLSPDGTMAIQVLADMMNLRKQDSTSSCAFLYDTRTGKILKTAVNTGITAACSFTEDGKTYLIGSRSYSLKDGTKRQFGFDSECFAHILENRFIVALGSNNKLQVYHLETGDLLLEAEAAENPSSLACSPDGTALYMGNAKGELTVWFWDHLYEPRKNVEPPVSNTEAEGAAEEALTDKTAETSQGNDRQKKSQKTSFLGRLLRRKR